MKTLSINASSTSLKWSIKFRTTGAASTWTAARGLPRWRPNFPKFGSRITSGDLTIRWTRSTLWAKTPKWIKFPILWRWTPCRSPWSVSQQMCPPSWVQGPWIRWSLGLSQAGIIQKGSELRSRRGQNPISCKFQGFPTRRVWGSFAKALLKWALMSYIREISHS